MGRSYQINLIYFQRVGPRSPLYTVSFVTDICVKTVTGNISLINPKNTKWCHLDIGDLFKNVKQIPQKCVNISVNNATFLYVHSMFPSINIKLLMKCTNSTNWPCHCNLHKCILINIVVPSVLNIVRKEECSIKDFCSDIHFAVM